MVKILEDLGIYKNKKILVTGHTGFKGAWLTLWLTTLGAKVVGFSLKKYDNDILFNSLKFNDEIIDERGDINDYNSVVKLFEKHKPEIVFHLAAQPLVRLSYDIPLETFNTNIIGTANILECIKNTDSVKVGVMITTDKCYKNKEINNGYTENAELGGHDPYSASKACAEIVIGAYRDSFFKQSDKYRKYIASGRAGNVIGGGDYSKDRLIPDCIKCLEKKESIEIRNPQSTRPWQHVLEPVYGYLLLGKKMLEHKFEFAQGWNFAPEIDANIEVGKIADLLVEAWGSGSWHTKANTSENKHEAKLLYLNIEKAKNILGWTPKLSINQSIQWTAEWYKLQGIKSSREICTEQIRRYSSLV